MAGSEIPNEPPPSYTQATGSSTTSAAGSSSNPTASTHDSHLNVPGASSSSSIPEAYRRSMELEARPLPEGWVRTLDTESGHQFYVDTRATPPRSTWDHPYDDEQYLATLSGPERERIEQENMTSYLGNGKHDPSMEDIIHGHSDLEDDAGDHKSKPKFNGAPVAGGAAAGSAAASSSAHSDLPPRPTDGKGKGKDGRSFGRKFKDKVTGTTHEERSVARAKREEEEQKMYEQHLRIREAMQKAMRTGESQYLGKDRNGEDVWLQPPPRGQMAYGGGFGGGGMMGYPGAGRMVNPYMSGPYAPGGMYNRPMAPFGRRGYGGGTGMGMPIALGGGLLAGGLLGGMMF
ncbi:unnamed protein product [Zymoseptoria tritici ST99CH_1A5]|uniref:WW domain-containing protein n=3 Tax=Zymoseptoria tritici TaxID=1047171 RepID=F9XMN2_ZYMTI|nr:uncharacterized protein MYCGRDRAFT_111195 [Zymoseptoria tritici IPO323]EGP83673.1 hypothetical protein MYCGRDRAFT_111195 [Zymoseptoria tritici IPO323]SMR60297.1 unnamed protein product [Zymoseptoria tritici ST99CH_1E4]SMR63408.1 unnamed protein product [Zymoseptoria tritici ST99CH_3D1]SMY28751.1 unnamed protein product [Zymoseptoria tritici ST99CH_1A5]